MTDFQRFEFIFCANNERLIQESCRYIQALNLPAGFTLGIQAIKNSASMAKGYNEGMRGSDAKYKIYLHQDVNILNPNFCYDILTLFQKYPNLGIMGVLGAKQLPPNGIWWDAPQTCGKVYYFDQLLLCNTEVSGEYESVQALDGMILITQYDLPWREDILTGWHFYDAAQSLEFIKAGYAVGIPRQTVPWCAHNCRSPMIPFQAGKFNFTQEYQRFYAR